MKKMTKINFIKEYIFTLELINLDFGFRVKRWSFWDMISNFKNFKIKRVILVIFLGLFCDKNLKMTI